MLYINTACNQCAVLSNPAFRLERAVKGLSKDGGNEINSPAAWAVAESGLLKLYSRICHGLGSLTDFIRDLFKTHLNH